MILDKLFRDDGASDAALDRHGRIGLVVLGVVALVVGPVVNATQPYLMNILVPMLLYALLVLSLDFLFGYCGMASFGHAAMFGVGGYVAAFLLRGSTTDPVVVVVAAFVAGVVVAFVMGVLSVRSTGLYFAFLTLAFTEMFHVMVFKDIPADVLGGGQITHGSNGLVGIPTFSAPLIDFGDPLTYYFVVLVVLGATTLFIVRLANSPFGTVMRGIRENEERMTALGYNATVYKVVAFCLTGGLAGMAGALYVPFMSIATPDLLNWTLSGDLIVYSLIGGMGTLWGPMIAAAGIQYIELTFTSIHGWPIILGLIYIVIILFAPNGIAGLLGSSRDFLRAAREDGLNTAVGQVSRHVRERFRSS